MKTQVYNLDGKATSEIDLPEAIFSVGWNPDLVQQAVLAQAANRRLPWAHAKGRGEVSGGGKKPWKQKHTGRARQGSIRSPIWKGGGVSHGPTKERDFSVKINKKMLRGAIASILSKRLSDGELKVVETFKVSGKTKDLARSLSSMSPRLNALLIPGKDNKMIYRASANIPNVKSLSVSSINVYDLLKFKQILIEANAVGEMSGSNKSAK